MHQVQRICFSAALLCLLFVCPAAYPQDARAEAGESAPLWRKIVVGVPSDVASAVYRSTVRGERKALLAWGAVGASFLLDETVREEWQDNVNSSTVDDVSGVLYDSGLPKFGLTVIGGGLVASWAFEKPHLTGTLLMAAESALLSQAASETFKSVFGRVRPRDVEDGSSTHWGEGSESFVSGHASGAWSVATVFAHRYQDSRVIPALAYGWATGVSIGRIHDDGHWLSDVVAGGMIGYLIGRSVVRVHGSGRGEPWRIAPLMDADTVGVRLVKRF